MTQQEYSYKPGTVRSLKLVNFMCHESFELVLGPRVNFVIGPNGSGKSALLTALVVVLGGRATTTSRAKRANEFVMYGKKYAKITCVIHNYDKIMEKDQAFKPDDYGKRIVIEKIIFTEDTSRLVLKNDKDKKVSERKQELDEMLEHFGILINNPICILNQEVSKSFLHSKKPEDKFELFMKATNLEQIEQDYDEAKRTHGSWSECNNRKSSGYKVLDSEYMSCKEKVSFLINRAKLQDTHRELIREMVWAMIRDHEEKADETQQKIEQFTKAIETHKCDTDQRKDLIEKSTLRIDQQKEKKIQCDQECEASRKKLDDNRKKDTLIKTRRIDVETKIDLEKRKMARLERDRASLETSIADIRKKLTIDTSAEENERRKLEIQRLEREMPSEKAREKSIRQHTEQLSHSMTETRNELHKLSMRITNLTTELSSKQSALRRLKSGEVNALGKYGDHMVKICEEINKYVEAGHLKKKPLGPLGFYVTLKSPDVARALELHLGKNAYAFTCDSVQDSQTLHNIFKQVKAQSYNTRWHEPLVLIRRSTRRHDTNKFKAQHDRYSTLLDYIEVKEDAVYNILVDRSSLESVLFIPDYEDAENLMINPPLIPRFTRVAYTRDCHQMYPRTKHGGYRCIANNPPNMCLFSRGNADEIRETEKQIAILEAEMRDIQANKQRLDESYNVQRKEHDSNYAEIRKILEGIRKREQELLNLKTTLTAVQPEELSAFEAEHESCITKIAQCKRDIEKENATLASIQDEREEVSVQRESIMNISKKRDDERQRVLDLINKEQSAILTHRDTIKENELQVKICENKILEEKKNLELHLGEIASAKSNVNDSEKPNTIRETSLVKQELKKVERQLNTEIEENADPDELLASLKRRMLDIENIVELKEHNQHNFNASSMVLKSRDDGYKTLRSNTCSSVATTFASVMRAMGMNGMLRIHLDDYVVDGHVVSKAKTLEMSIDTTASSQRPGRLTQNDANTSNACDNQHGQQLQQNGRRSTRSQPAESAPRIKRARFDVSPSEKENRLKLTDTRSLSGGERSFSTVAFVLALWHHCSSPFKLMDEIDVFMDMVTRRISYNALIKFAQVTENPGQFIFFSPLELPRIEDTENLVRVFEMPRIIRKQATQASAGATATASSSFAGTVGGGGDE